MNTDKTQMNADAINNITGTIIGCGMKVSNKLGVGFLEKVYENALAIELKRAGMSVEQQKPISVFYDGILVGNYVADLFVNDNVLVELKVAKAIEDAHEAQLLNYLRATNLRIGLILNFGQPRMQFTRKLL